jgi:hypothetical protein
MLNFNLNSHLTNIIDTSNFISNNKIANPNEYILDPLSTIIKLAILSNKPIGTKLSISNNIISIQEPGLFQSICRYSYNTNKTELQYLYNPIEIACKFYLTSEYTKQYPSIIQLFQCAQNGINKLSDTYKNCNMIRLCLNYYNGIITNYFDKLEQHIFLENLFKKDSITPLYTEDILSQLDELWTSDRVQVILNLTSFLLNDRKPYDNVKTIETIMCGVDQQVQQIIL